MFLSEEKEGEFFSTLAAYEAEFGADRLIVIIPTSWLKSIDLNVFQPMTVKTWNTEAIGIRVQKISAKYTQKLSKNTEQEDTHNV